MGFTRNNEGRIFFQSKDIEHQVETPAPKLAKPQSKKKDASQMQILALLKALNGRLQSTQIDREKMSQEIEKTRQKLSVLEQNANAHEEKATALEAALKSKKSNQDARAKNAEKLADEALQELKETRKLLLEIEDRASRSEASIQKQASSLRLNEERLSQQQSKVEQLKKQNTAELESRIKRSEQAIEAFDSRIEEAITRSEKLDRKIDKAIEERSRFLRKLERIEETVIQTNEALNARAMVLLTDQDVAAQSQLPQQTALGPATQGRDKDAHDAQTGEELPWWQKKLRVDPLSAATAMVVVLLLGWGVNEIQKPGLSSLDYNNFFASNAAQTGSASALEPARVSANETVEPDAFYKGLAEKSDPEPESYGQDNAGRLEQTAWQSVASSTGIQDPGMASVDLGAQDDSGVVDLNSNEQLLAAFENNPEQLGDQLNAIEPSARPNANTQSGLNTVEQGNLGVDLGTQSANTQNLIYDDMPAAPAAALSERIQADTALTGDIKEIENQAFAGVAEAQHDLAAIYTAGHGGVTQDYQRARLWFEAAAHNGIANARYNLGVMYHQGIGVTPDLKTAFQWYHAAADLGHAEAQYNLGIAYIEGVGVPYDPVKAAEFFENAAESGVIEAAYNLGLIYENGLLGNTAPDKALMWYKTAADKGSPEAKAALENLAKSIGVGLSDVNHLVETMQAAQNAGVKKNARYGSNAVLNTGEAANAKALNQLVEMDAQTLQVSRAQDYLITLGLYPGPADGISGMLTKDAIRAYQGQNGLEQTGRIDEDLLANMAMSATNAGHDLEIGSRDE